MFAVWRITIEGDSMVLSEQSGSHCCLFVPNPFLKTHRFQDMQIILTLIRCWISGHFSYNIVYRMMREDENTWGGTLGCKRVYVKKVIHVNVVQALRRKKCIPAETNPDVFHKKNRDCPTSLQIDILTIRLKGWRGRTQTLDH